jgi:hypothetical protein
MLIEEIAENLCIYDERNPSFWFDPNWETKEEHIALRKNPCYCDNCFYHRTKLAEELISRIA